MAENKAALRAAKAAYLTTLNTNKINGKATAAAIEAVAVSNKDDKAAVYNLLNKVDKAYVKSENDEALAAAALEAKAA